MKELPLKKIVFDVNTQMRERIDGDVVNEYRDAMKDGVKFPPVVVFFDGSTYWLADGYHRWHAASEAGIDTLQCDVKQGSRRDAILYACGANTCNGLRRTIEDKQRAVKTLLTDSEWSQWSDGTIAEQCGVSRQMVSDWRSQVASVATCSSRKGKDGKTYKPPKRKPKKAAPSTQVKDDDDRDDEPSTGKASYDPAAINEPEEHPLRTLIALAEHHDMDLATVIERWPFLSPHIRTKVRNTVTDYT
mgnify:CR=1 FL=1|jgi:hypothetical protein